MEQRPDVGGIPIRSQSRAFLKKTVPVLLKLSPSAQPVGSVQDEIGTGFYETYSARFE